MAELGWFQDQRVELVDGEIIEMSPQAHSHVVAIARVERELRSLFGDDYWIRNQAPLRFASASEPEPDLAVVLGTLESYDDHPSHALLIVEVSESSLTYDSTRKASLYAAAGIADYWIVNLIDRRLEVYRNPVADSTTEFGYRYADVQRLQPRDIVTPLARLEAQLTVAHLLP